MAVFPNILCKVMFFFAFFLSCFGLIACGDDDDGGDLCASIGNRLSLQTDGIVLDDGGVPIKGIVIYVSNCIDYSQTSSDINGEWNLDDDCYELFDNDEILVTATDTDGTENGGQFLDTEVSVPIIQTGQANEEQCYWGEFSASDIVLVMELAE